MADSGRFSIIPARAFDDSRLGAAPLRLLGLLGTYSNKQGWCWPAVATLAQRLGQVPRAIQKNLSTLVDLGYVQVRTNSGHANHYKILHDIELEEQFDRTSTVTPERHVHPYPRTFTPTPERHVHPTPERHVHPERPIERPKKETYASGAAEYAFEGRVIRLNPKDYLRWKQAYPAILDLKAELQSLDDYYTHTLDDRSKWFCRASTALKKANTRALTDAKANAGASKRNRPQLLDMLAAADEQIPRTPNDGSH